MIDIGSDNSPVKKTIAERLVSAAVKVVLFPVVLAITWVWRKKR